MPAVKSTQETRTPQRRCEMWGLDLEGLRGAPSPARTASKFSRWVTRISKSFARAEPAAKNTTGLVLNHRCSRTSSFRRNFFRPSIAYMLVVYRAIQLSVQVRAIKQNHIFRRDGRRRKPRCSIADHTQHASSMGGKSTELLTPTLGVSTQALLISKTMMNVVVKMLAIADTRSKLGF